MQSRKRSAPPPASLTTEGDSLPSLARGGGEWCGASSSRHPLKVRRFFEFSRQIQRDKSCRLHRRPVEPLSGLACLLAMPCPKKTRLAASACRCCPFSARCWPTSFLINRFFGLSITTNLSGMARTRAGLSGRPTSRPGVICPGLSAPQGWPLAAMSAGLPVGTLRPCLISAVDQPRAAGAALRSVIWP